MKPYQISLISLAIDIALLTLFVSWFVGRSDIVEPVPRISPQYSGVKVFFPNKVQDSDNLSCEKTYPASREISMSTNNSENRLGEIAYIAIKELLKGPTEADKAQGFFTSINLGAKVQKISIVEGVANVEFDEEFNRGVAGSCRVQTIRSQIEETLKQFPEIKEVIISVDGDSKTILQP
ncbi:MAG: GerMN domain-containing protein [Candidatus Yanofskybacteria bacterium]|nr:GerMN domain-containing protein [Candidatus Yanofskybacteria bacterium]